MRVQIDSGRCQGHALCVLNAGEFFDLDEVSSRAVTLFEQVPADLIDQVRRAQDNCPEGAISVTR